MIKDARSQQKFPPYHAAAEKLPQKTPTIPQLSIPAALHQKKLDLAHTAALTKLAYYQRAAEKMRSESETSRVSHVDTTILL